VEDLPSGWISAAGVLISNFSSRGPTDDGRIKPDVVANGRLLTTSILETFRPQTVTNADFELPVLSAGGSTSSLNGWSFTAGGGGGAATITHTTLSGGKKFNGSAYNSLRLTGQNSRVWQDLTGVTLVPSRNYRMIARLGRHSSLTSSSGIYVLRVFVNGFTTQVAAAQVLASQLISDEFSEWTMTFTTTATPPGGTVRVVLENFGPTGTGSSCFFDNVTFGFDHPTSAIPNNVYSDGSLLGLEQFSGTSFAAPSVTGSLALLDQSNASFGYGARYGAPWKALLIHTADEAGSVGPDYTFGWGLMNTKAAAGLLAANAATSSRRSFMREGALFDGNTIDIPVKSSGTQPLKVTLCWADPAWQNATTAPAAGGVPTTAPLNGTTPMLINDLNLRVISPSSQSIGPWQLALSSGGVATAPSTSTNDSLNNVEQVLVASPAQGTHTIRISRGGSAPLRLSKLVVGSNPVQYELVSASPTQPVSQRYSLVISGNDPLPGDKFGITSFQRTSTQHVVEWSSVKGARYSLQKSANLSTWSDVTGNDVLGNGSSAAWTVDAVGATTQVTIPAATQPAVFFYRVKEVGL
jgi:hypothetical protein